MKRLSILLSLAVLILMIGCKKDSVQTLAEPEESAEIQRYTGPIELSTLTDRSSCPWIVIPAGSVDALADAIANICDDGVIYLKAGTHTENHPLTISKPVKIIGESGAVLEVASALSLPNAAGTAIALEPFFHFLDAPGSLVQDLEIKDVSGNGGLLLLFENSHGSGVMRNKMTAFQYSIMVEKSDRMTIMFNTIVTTSLWQTGGVPNAFGITVINGRSNYLSDNDVSNSTFGIWACDRWSTAERNHTHGNYIGLILCNVPMAYQLPSGVVTGSEIPATGWKTRNNKSSNNLAIGYLVIDGANSNLLENNEGGNNGAYDMELTTDTYRFGFLTPAAFNNTVHAGAYNITIKNCGPNNTINGGTLVDTTVDPCN